MESIWTKTCQIPERPPLEGDLTCEVAVIGAGMAGLLTARSLQQTGHRTVVLEAERIAGGQTRNTTAKITSQHGLIYADLLSTLGQEGARAYADANETAIRDYRRLIRRQKISCDLETADAYVFGNDLQKLRREAEAAARLGLPAEFVERPAGPMRCAGAVRFADQARFHPLKFLKAVAEDLTVYENTPVQKVEGGTVFTTRGRVKAETVIFACHYPFPIFPGFYFARLHQERSYVLALENVPRVEGMWIGTEGRKLSFRSWGDLLLLGGGGHRTGENSAGGQYEALRRAARELFPDSREAACWSAQDCVTPDRIPMVGRFSAGRPNWYVATGFQKWGMTGSMAAANLLRELIEGRKPPVAAVYDPGRFRAGLLCGLAREGGHAVKGLTRRLFQVPETKAEDLAPGRGGVVLHEGKKVGAYRESDGTLHLVDVRCPHLGCQLEWNPDELSWDCPCHGSRFDYRGRQICGPAQKDL